MTEIAKVKYLIIGNSAGGIGAAEAIREVDRTGTMTILSDEPYPAYSRPLISKYLAEKRPLGKMLFRPTDFYKQNNIQTLLGSNAQKLNITEHTIEIEGGKKIAWEKLLLATGGSPVIPKIAGLERKGVFTFITLDDAKTINRFLNQLPQGTIRAVVIGGGLIGVSVTEALVKRGVQVAIVEMKDWILNTMLDKETATIVAKTLRQAGVNIITGHTAIKITSDLTGAADGVTLDDNQSLPAELVISASGVKPRTDLVIGTRIKINRGIVVDHHMTTSVPDIYACGDVAEIYDFIYEETRVTPIWPSAYIGGRICGFNMANVPKEYPESTAMNSLNYFGLDVVSAGMCSPPTIISKGRQADPPNNSYEVLTSQSNHTHRRIVLKNGRVVGLVFIGNVEKSGIIHNLIKERINVSRFKRELLADDLSLATLPREIWQPHLTPTNITMAHMEKPEGVTVGE
ncbi:MAG: FAD-dependent oxidoreductase [Dehalococcoidales bacterium]|jgi:NAD(P)H-nitrite reductase large subunit|nr:FAD-dependent oxidoreductase [Dehalococcoidales bacterium]MDP7309882.1 FAD-dependent oxidoreductase [Dehalococcoidales bacterium]MDP7409712.1 FAD-dependent oxidoreductase [Dehalococcoidales bacterium]